MDKDQVNQEKVKKALEIICKLYENNYIHNAFIVGSVAEGTASESSDVDIVILNPLFKSTDDRIYPEHPDPIIRDIANFLKNSRITFRFIKLPQYEEIYIEELIEGYWYQLYKNEIFQITTIESLKELFEPNIEITKDLC